MTDESDSRSRRQLAKAARRRAGDRSADLARDLMQLKPAALAKLEVEDELREEIDRARAIPSLSARRRAERALAGTLRRFDLDELATQLANIAETGAASAQPFHLGEHWRTRLLEDDAALAEFPHPLPELPVLIANARRERDTGKPPGAKRALFRAIMAALTAKP